LFFACCSLVINANAAQPKETINQTMTKIGTVLGGAYPRLMAKRDLNVLEQNQLVDDITKLTTLFRDAEPHIRQKSDSYQISYQLVVDHLGEASTAAKERDFESARLHLYSLATLCTSCHTQDGKQRTLFTGVDRTKFDDDLAYAEFNFSTRNYGEARQYFEKYLAASASSSPTGFRRIVRRLIVIYVQVYNRPGDGAKYLRTLFTLPHLAPPEKKFLEQSIHGLEQLTAARVEEESNIGFESIAKKTSQYLGNYFSISPVVFSTPEEDVARLWLRGVLYRYLNEKASTEEIPVILYWLSVCDRALSYDNDSSLADSYLKECVVKYPSHPYAQRCFDEYEHYVNVTFTSATEPFPPINVRRDLEALRKMIKRRPDSRNR